MQGGLRVGRLAAYATALGLTPIPLSRRAISCAALLAAGLGCTHRAPAAHTRLTWHVVDRAWVAPWDEMTDSVATYRVVLRTGTVADTLSEVLPPWPVVIDDSTVWGLRRVPGRSARELFRWTGPRRPLAAWPLPTDVLGDFHDVMISPDGRHLAYVGLEEAGPYAAVAALPSRRRVWRSATVGGCDCDVDLSHARWVSPDSFEIAVVSTADRRGWAIFAGSAARRQAGLRFVPQEPDWHTGTRP